MREKTPRAISLEILQDLEETDKPLDQLLTDFFKRYRHLRQIDRSFLTELTYGVLRWKEKCDWIIRRFSKIPFDDIDAKILNILRLGVYQLLFLTKTPAPAAVNESVNLAKKIRGRKGGGFVNAILRSYLRNKDRISLPDFKKKPAIHISINHSHPLWLINRWLKEIGLEETQRVCIFNNTIPPLTLRTNTLFIDRENLIEKLKLKELKTFPTRFSEDGIYILDPPPISDLPFLKDGLYIIQDEASQLVTTILDPKQEEKILDACASPGGKTTHIAQRIKNKGEIYALDVNQEKLNIVKRICNRLGVNSVRLIKGDATKPLPLSRNERFDKILADVPCSGFGTLRRNPDLKWKKDEKDIKRLSELQYAILENLSFYLKEGGILVYSTCTIFREEDEDVVERFLSNYKEFKLDDIKKILPERLHIFVDEKGYFKTFPPKNGMDGFFIARIKR